MDKLDNYIKYINENTIKINELDYALFGYNNFDEMELDLNLLISSYYNNIVIDYNSSESEEDDLEHGEIIIRKRQKTFRDNLIKRYGKCIISDSDCLDELEAAHIIPFSDSRLKSGFIISNGLLLKANLHKTFDKYKWSINPLTLEIEIKMDIDVGEIKKYKSKYVGDILDKNDKILINNLESHYNIFLEN
jgi:hypothetical protein